MRRVAGDGRTRTRRISRTLLPLRRGRKPRRGGINPRALSPPAIGGRSLRADARALGRDVGDDSRAHARSIARYVAQSLAALSDAGLPRLGALGLLPVGRRLRLPRPVAGRDG